MCGKKNDKIWLIQTGSGTYGTDYLLSVAVAKYGLGANAAEEAFYPVAMTVSSGKNLTGGVNYTIHFKPSQIPPVNKLGFWSMTRHVETNSTSVSELPGTCSTTLNPTLLNLNSD